MKNILLVVRWPVGGIRTYLRYIYRNLDRTKYHFTLIAPHGPEMEILQQDLIKLNIDYKLTDSNFNTKQFIKLIYNTAKSGNYDIIHSHGFTSAILSLPIAKLTGVKHLMTVHDVLRNEQFSGYIGKTKKLVLRIILPMVDYVHVVSRDSYSNLMKYSPGLKSKTTIVPHGIDIDRFTGKEERHLKVELELPENAFVIGFFGRFMSQKGFKYLIDAMEIIQRCKELPVQPVVVSFGAGNYIREEKQNVKQRGLEDQFYYLPFESNLSAALKGVDVAVIPSLWEACGLIAMEALVAGTPVVGTDCIGLREVLDNTPASIVKAGDANELAEAIKNRINNPGKQQSIAFVPEAVKRFDARNAANGLDQIYCKI